MKRSLFYSFILGASAILFGCEERIRWTAIGDSITYLNDHTHETGDRITKGYMTLLRERHPSIEYINKGFNGWTTGNIASGIDTLGLVASDVYTVFLGTNDWWQGRPVGAFSDFTSNTGDRTLYGAYRVILDKLRSLNPKAKIILLTPLQRSDFVYFNDYRNNAFGSYRSKDGQDLSEFADAIIHIAKSEQLPVVDLYYQSNVTPENAVRFKYLKDPLTGEYRNFGYPEYTTIPFHPDTDEYPYPEEAIHLTYDGLHPSDEGYVIIADMLEKEIVKHLAD